METSYERIGDSLVFRAGSGEWFNQPGNYRWDMGEDAEKRPPSQWHVELRRLVDSQQVAPPYVVVDTTGMAKLVGVDWGFLVVLGKQLSQGGTRLAIAGTKITINCARIAKLTQFFDVCGSVDEAVLKTP